MDTQRFLIAGHILGADAPDLQDRLALVYDTPERPRCLCVPQGVEMYVARHQQYVIKRMPGSGSQHRPNCPSYEVDHQQSGLGELMGEAVLERAPGDIELRVNFPWTRLSGRSAIRGEPQEAREVESHRRRMSLGALMHFLFERAGFNYWTPAMAGKRNQWVLQKYLVSAARDVMVKGVPLTERLYVPEPFSEHTRHEVAQRRRLKLAVLQPKEGQTPLAVVLGEYKTCDSAEQGRRVWIKHMPDTPLLIANRTWARIEKVFATLFEARDADNGCKVRLVMAALIRARREHTYEIDAASLMLTSEHWIPLEGVHELPLVQALIAQRRRFAKPLRYDAQSAAPFANVQLLDAGPTPIPLHILSAYLPPKEHALKVKALAATSSPMWAWSTYAAMPAFPRAAEP